MSSHRMRPSPLVRIHRLGGDEAVIALARCVATVNAAARYPGGAIPPTHWRIYLIGHLQHPAQRARFGQSAAQILRLLEAVPDQEVVRLVRSAPLAAATISERRGCQRPLEGGANRPGRPSNPGRGQVA